MAVTHLSEKSQNISLIRQMMKLKSVSVHDPIYVERSPYLMMWSSVQSDCGEHNYIYADYYEYTVRASAKSGHRGDNNIYW